MEELKPEERIAQLEKQAESLLQEIFELQNTIVDWHSAMYGAIHLILKPHKCNLQIQREHLLNLMPTRIDCIVVKKDETIPIDLDVFRLFRKHNVIEFKSYRDSLDEDVLWHTIGYAAMYKSLEQGVSSEELTISIFRSTPPQKLLVDLAEQGWRVERPYHNIFYLSGKVDIPIQIVVTRDLGEAYLPLSILTGHAKEAEVRKFLEYREGLREKADLNYADAVTWACSQANAELFKKLREDKKMNGVLREIMKEDFLAAEREAATQAEANTYRTVAERLISIGTDGATIVTATGYDRKYIDSIAHRLNRTVAWNEART